MLFLRSGLLGSAHHGVDNGFPRHNEAFPAGRGSPLGGGAPPWTLSSAELQRILPTSSQTWLKSRMNSLIDCVCLYPINVIHANRELCFFVAASKDMLFVLAKFIHRDTGTVPTYFI